MNDTGLQMKYFVLNPRKEGVYGAASRAAMLSYASAIEDVNPALAVDLRAWVRLVLEEK